jgi:hypothetical protein
MSCIRYRQGTYKYQLRRPHVERTSLRPERTICTDWIALETDGTMTISSGYAWDGASGPTWDSKSSMRGSLVHDAAYQLLRMELLPPWFRVQADAEFRRICIEDGMFRWRAHAWHWAVRTLASGAAEAKSEPADEYAPIGCCK